MLLLVAAGGRTRPFAVALLLALHPLDAFGWKYRTAWLESLPLGPGQRRLQRIEASPYVPRRVASIVDAPRFQEFHREDPYYLDAEESRAPRERWPSAGFWSTDAVEGPGRAEYWMKPWERLATALGGTPEGGERDSCWKRSPGELLSGLDEDKIQFFAGAAVLPAEEIERRLGGSGPFPDVLYVEGGPSGDRAAGSSRLRLPCRVTAWEADRLAIELEVPAGGAWLYYADAWDPCWSATVNGVPREIARANLAYKALWLEGGAGRVEFRATSPLRTACGLLLGLHQAFWLVGILWAAFRLAGGGRSAP